MDKIIQDIQGSIKSAINEKKKIAMFHWQVLKNADYLGTYDPEKFCTDIDVPKSYAVEFQKMLRLSKIINEQGYLLSPKVVNRL
ncbi:hypothetical protein MASR2M48_33970 [Spirochaetota bacterium]